MCIAIYKPAESGINPKDLKNFHKSNPDGCGFMFAEHGLLHVKKGYMDYKEFHRKYDITVKHYPLSNVVLHFRTASTSDKNDDTCHPFFVNKHLAFVHNGNFFEFSPYFKNNVDDGRSDTQKFNDEILNKLPKDFLEIPAIIDCLERYCKDNMSKLIFMDRYGHVTLINEEAGEWTNDTNFHSNGGLDDYSGYGFSGVYYYNDIDVRHKGGLQNVRCFDKKTSQTYAPCGVCDGYFKKPILDNGVCPSCLLFEELVAFTGKELKRKVKKKAKKKVKKVDVPKPEKI